MPEYFCVQAARYTHSNLVTLHHHSDYHRPTTLRRGVTGLGALNNVIAVSQFGLPLRGDSSSSTGMAAARRWSSIT